jgi:hypothetical protein
MQGLGLGRVGLAVAAFGLVVSGVVVATEGNTFPGPLAAYASPASVALAPAAGVSCLAAGPYRAPERGSVGLPVGLGLCPSGSMVITTPGVVLDGWDVRGGITVDAPDVVVRRSRVTGDGSSPFGIRTTERGSVRIEDTTLTGEFPEAAVVGDRWTAERVEITGVSHHGAQLGSGARLRNSVVHGLAPAAGVETHGLVLVGSDGDVLVEDNRIDRGLGQGSAVLVAPAPGGESGRDGPVVIRGNVLGGGGYTLRQAPDAAVLSEVRITSNRFQRGPGVEPLRVPSSFVLMDNTFVDGGMLPER